jgi:hypothetical protein
MDTISKYAQALVYSLLCLMPTVYQKASLNAVLGLFLEAQGKPLPAHTQVKSGSSLSRFFNKYKWSSLGVFRAMRKALLAQLKAHPVPRNQPLKVIFDLTTLAKCGQFRHLNNPVPKGENLDPWVRVLNGKRGLHLVVMYLVIGQWRLPLDRDSLIEVFRNPATNTEIRTCQGKFSRLESELNRKAKRQNQTLPEDDLPHI